MSNLWAVIYGFIQGISEFLPVSSSGHLALLPKFFNISDPGVIFDLVMHLGTAFAVIIYYHKDIKKLLVEFVTIVKERSLRTGFFFQNFTLATFCSFLFILLIKNFALEFGRTGTLIGANLIFFGILMFLSDLKKEDKTISLVEDRNYLKAIIIGMSQSFAIFPGVSRSGITLTSARFMRLSRLEASRFSFLLSLPIILGSIAYKLPDILSGQAVNVDLSVILIGIVSSFLFGILTIHFFLKVISKMGLWIFALYRVIIGLLVWYIL